MSDSIHDDCGDDRPVRPRGFGSKPMDVIYIIVAAILVAAMMGLLLFAAFEK